MSVQVHVSVLNFKSCILSLKGEQCDSCQNNHSNKKLNIAALLNNKIEIKMFNTNVSVFPKEPL